MGLKLLFSANWVKAEPEVREQQFHKTRLKKCLSTALVLEDLQPVGAAAPYDLTHTIYDLSIHAMYYF